jgi:hypothetical protein
MISRLSLNREERLMKRMTVIIIFALVAMSSALNAISQERQEEKPQPRRPAVAPRVAVGPLPMPAMSPAEREIHFINTEMSFVGKPVKGAPYSAEAVSESVQVLADGNRIVRRSTSMVYRDSEGRTRHEQTLRSVGPYAVAGEPPQMIFINDPVENVNYILDARNRTARKMSRPRIEVAGDGADFHIRVESASGEPERRAVEAERMAVEAAAAGGVRMRRPAAGPVMGASAIRVEPGEGAMEEAKTESLGTQMIEGVQAEGNRATVTIPAGKIGNELPILIVSESWYSPELQVRVLTRHSDPRFGEQSYRLTGINRSEPAKSLFEVPSDYTVKEAVPPEMRLKMERELQRKRSNEQ